MSQSILDIILRSKKEGTGVTDSKKEVDALGESTQKYGKIALGVAVAGVTAVTAAIGDSIKETMEYNKSIRDLAQNLAITTEETSRIVQTADDFTVSQQDVTAALQMAVKNGMKPNIDTLARMADLYNSISDPTERAARLTEVFGRNWAALTPMLKEGGRAIRDAAAAQSDALIVTEEQSKATRDLEINLDNLGDKVLALKLKVGNALVPVLNEAANAIGYLSDGMGTADKIETELSRAVAQNVFWFGSEADITKASMEALRSYVTQKENAINTTDANDRALRRETDAINASALASTTAQANMALFSASVALSSQTFVASYTAMYGSVNMLTAAQGELTTATLYAEAAKNLDATAALELGLRLGVISSSSVDALRALQDLRVKADSNKDGFISAKEAAAGYISEVRDIAAAQKLIERNINITITTRRVGGALEDDGTVTNGRAGGGPVAERVAVNVNELNRERFVPYAGGSMLPATTNNLGPVSIVINGAGQNAQTIAQAVAIELGRMANLAESSGAGMAGM